MVKDTITENGLFLLGSSCEEHANKGVSLRLDVGHDALISNPSAKAWFIADTKAKLARIHNVQPEDIVIVAFTKGSAVATPAVRGGTQNMNDNAATRAAYQKGFPGQYVGHEFHPAFQTLQVSQGVSIHNGIATFEWMATGEKRGGQPYYPPKGCDLD
jgi:hypothetical protein